MKRKSLIFLTSAIIITLNGAPGIGKTFVNYENSEYNYRVIIPETWKKTITSDKSKQVLLITNNYNTSIKIEAVKSSDDIDKIIHEKKWDLRQIDSRVESIIETPTVTLKNSASGKLLVFEYFSNRSTFLHRVFVSKNNGMAYIIDCKAPVWYFYRVEEIFNTALASFGYLSTEKTESKTEEKAEPKSDNKKSIVSKKKEAEELDEEDNGSEDKDSSRDDSDEEDE